MFSEPDDDDDAAADDDDNYNIKNKSNNKINLLKK